MQKYSREEQRVWEDLRHGITVLSKVAGILKCDLDLCRKSARISKVAEADRDLLIYIAWQLGVATNQQIGEKFGLTYSAVSQRVSGIKEKLNKNKELARKYRQIKSLIKI